MEPNPKGGSLSATGPRCSQRQRRWRARTRACGMADAPRAAACGPGELLVTPVPVLQRSRLRTAIPSLLSVSVSVLHVTKRRRARASPEGALQGGIFGHGIEARKCRSARCPDWQRRPARGVVAASCQRRGLAPSGRPLVTRIDVCLAKRRPAAGLAAAAPGGHTGPGWAAWARLVVRGRWLAAAALAVLGALGAAPLGVPCRRRERELAVPERPGTAGARCCSSRPGDPTGLLTPIEVPAPGGTSTARIIATAPGV